MVFLGLVAYIVNLLAVVKVEKIGRYTANRMIFLSVIGFAVLGVSAFILNSVFHTIETGYITIGGITWLGGVIGAVPFMIFAFHKFAPKAKGNALNYFSLFIPGLVIGHAFGRMGCFFAGCCYGGVTDSIFGVVFPEGSLAAEQYPSGDGTSLPVWPTQLFEACFEFALFLVMMIFRKKLKKYNIEIYCIAYGIFRFLIEFLRGDDRGATGMALTPSQIMSIILLIGAVCLILFRNGVIFKKLNAKCAVWREEAAAYNDTVPAPSRADGAAVAAVAPAEALKQLHELFEQGIITREEYEAKKKDLLNRM